MKINQILDTEIKVTVRPAFARVNVIIYTEEHGEVEIEFDSESFLRWVPAMDAGPSNEMTRFMEPREKVSLWRRWWRRMTR